MLFNSTIFLQFFAAFLLLYFLCRNSLKARNLLILLSSCLFYGWWDYRFLALLLFSGSFDYLAGLLISRADSTRRKQFLIGVSLVVNLGILGFFKYFNFFIESFGSLLQPLGLNPGSLNILLPVGISFYTFQSLSYVIDIYRGHTAPAHSLVQYLAYVCFFPQLVAGPIERSRDLLPQFARPLLVSLQGIREGIWLTLWGLFKKVVIADNLAPLVDLGFGHPSPSGPIVMAAVLAFGIQIYGDFSGYSDTARGLARFLGFNLSVNFNLPYFSRDIREFWRRWHITLSTWLRDYLYISLGGNRQGSLRTYFNLFITMLLGGLWHGAAWNFVLWGAWHGIGLAMHRSWDSGIRQRNQLIMGISSWACTMAFVFYGWLLFRAGTWEQISTMTVALGYWPALGSYSGFLINLVLFSAPLLLVETWQYRAGNLFSIFELPGWARYTAQLLLLLALVLFWQKRSVPFIYFQF